MDPRSAKQPTHHPPVTVSTQGGPLITHCKSFTSRMPPIYVHHTTHVKGPSVQHEQLIHVLLDIFLDNNSRPAWPRKAQRFKLRPHKEENVPTFISRQKHWLSDEVQWAQSLASFSEFLVGTQIRLECQSVWKCNSDQIRLQRWWEQGSFLSRNWVAVFLAATTLH